MNVYLLQSYKQVILDKVAENKAKGLARSTFQEVAAHCRIQKTYLSKVLNREGHLTADQLYLAAEFLKFQIEEKDYLLHLHALEVSTLPSRRKELRAQIEKIQARNLRTEKHTAVRAQAQITSLDRQAYYVDPLNSLVHMFLTVKSYRNDLSEISRALSLSLERVKEYCERLERFGLVHFKSGVFEVVEDGIHLPAESELQTTYRSLMRLKALEKMSQSERDSFYSFSVIFSTDEASRAKIQARFLEFLNATQTLVKNGREEKVFQINFDLLSWS